MKLLLLSWLVLGLICACYPALVKRQVSAGSPFRTMTLEEILEPAEISQKNMNLALLAKMDPRILNNLDPATSAIVRRLIERISLRNLGRFQNVMEDPLEPAEFGDGGMSMSFSQIAAALARQRNGSAGNGGNSPRQDNRLSRQRSGSAPRGRISARGNAPASRRRSQIAVGYSRTSTSSASQSGGSAQRKNEAQSRASQNAPTASMGTGSSPMDSANNQQVSSSSRGTLHPDFQRLLDSLSLPNGILHMKNSPPNAANGQNERQANQQPASGNADQLPGPTGSQWGLPMDPMAPPSNQNIWSIWYDSFQVNQAPGAINETPSNFPQGSSNTPQRTVNGQQRMPNDKQVPGNMGNSQQEFSNMAPESVNANRGQVITREYRTSQQRAPQNAPLAVKPVTDPITFVDNLPTANLKVQLNQATSQNGTERNVQSNERSQHSNFQVANSKTKGRRGNSLFMNHLQAALANTLNVVDNPQNRRPNPTAIQDPNSLTRGQNVVLVNPSDPNAPGAPANAPVDIPPEWTTPGFMTPELGKSSVLVIPGSEIGKTVYTNV